MGVPNLALGYWLREYEDLGEVATQDVIALLQEGSANWFLQKCMDGTTWQGYIDSGLTPVRSVQDAATLMAEYQSSGIDFTPVVDPRGRDPIGEAIAHGALARGCGCLCVDLEPYAGFWDGSPLSNIISYCQRLRQEAGDAYLVLQPDPRNLGSIFFDSIYSNFNALSPQHYVGWDAVGWTDVSAEIESVHELSAYGLRYYPTIYGGGRTDLALAFATAIRGEVAGYQIFSLSGTSAADMQKFASLSPSSVPVDPCSDLRGQLEKAQGQIQAMKDLVAQWTN